MDAEILAASARGASLTEKAITAFRQPAIRTRRPPSRAFTAVRATSGEVLALLKSFEAPMVARSAKRVSVAPGHRAVTVTPVPATSSARASLRLRT